MKEFLEAITKQKSSLPLFFGVVLVVLGISSSIKWGGNTLSVEPAYRITTIVIGALLILLGVVLLVWGDGLSIGQRPGRVALEHIPSQGKKMQASLSKATQIDGFGYSLINFIRNNKRTLTEAVKNGATLRLVVIDPNGKSVEVMKNIKPTTGITEDVSRTLKIAKSIQAESKESIRGKLEIRVIDWIPSCTTIILDGATDHGWMEIGFFPPSYKKVTDSKAYLQLSRKVDKDWFDEYANAFNDVWEMAKPCE